MPLCGDVMQELYVSWNHVLETVFGHDDQRDSQRLDCGGLLPSRRLLPRLFAL